MKRVLPLLAILASSVFFLAAVPTPASAGNCTNINTSPTYMQGYGGSFPLGPPDGYAPNAQVSIGSCTGVDQIQFGCSLDKVNAYWADNTIGLTFRVVGYLGPCTVGTGVGAPVRTVTYGADNFCNYPGPTHRDVTFFARWRLESVDIHGVKTWGPWHWSSSVNANLNCFP
jgi:hypothetical protein